MQFVALIWFVGAMVLLARLGVGSLWFQFRLSRNHSPRKPELVELLARLRAELKLRSNPDIIETPLVASPCLFGFFKPRLLLPTDLHSHLSQAELSHVILHELAHLKRRDLFTNFLMVIAHAIHWFNPIVWLVFRRMRLERELACDQIVLQSRAAAAPKAYGQTLLKLLHDFTPVPSAPALVGIAEDKHSASVRLSHIAKFKPRATRFSLFGVALLIFLALCGLPKAQTNQPPAKGRGATAAPDSPEKNSLNSLPPISRRLGIEALESEYAQQKKVVEEARAKLNKARIELGIVEGIDGMPADTTAKEIEILHAAVAETRERFATDTATLDYLKKLSRAEIRKALPTMLRPPDASLNRYLEDLGKAEQQSVSISSDFSDEHVEVRRIREVIATIERQIEDRIDGILIGLEARRATAQSVLENLKSDINIMIHDGSRRQERYTPYFEARRSVEESQRLLDTIHMRLLAEKIDAQLAPQN